MKEPMTPNEKGIFDALRRATGAVKMNQFDDGRVVTIYTPGPSLDFPYGIGFYNVHEDTSVKLDNRFRTPHEAMLFLDVVCGHIEWNIL